MNIRHFGAIMSALALLACVITPGLAHADWTGGIEGGQVITGDNKGTKIRLKLSNSDRPFSQAIYADWIRGEDDDDSYEIGYTPRYWFSEQAYAFGEGKVQTSNVTNVELQNSLLAGVGIQLINTESQKLFAEAGAGQLFTRFETVAPGQESTESTGIAIGRLGASQVLSDLIKFELDADYATAEDLVTTTAEAGISLRTAGGAIKYSYRSRTSQFGDEDRISTNDSSVTFTYGF